MGNTDSSFTFFFLLLLFPKGSASGKIYIWEIPSQPLALGEDPNLRPCATIDGHTGVSRCVAFNPRTSGESKGRGR